MIIIRDRTSITGSSINPFKETRQQNKVYNIPASKSEEAAVERQHNVVHPHLAALEGKLWGQVWDVPWTRRPHGGHTSHNNNNNNKTI